MFKKKKKEETSIGKSSSIKKKETSIGKSSSILDRVSQWRKSVRKDKEKKNMETIQNNYRESISDLEKKITNSSDSVQTGKNMEIDKLLADEKYKRESLSTQQEQ